MAILPLVFFIFAFGTIVAILWSGYHLLAEQEDPLGDRLLELQSAGTSAASGERRSGRRRAGGGLLNSIVYLISVVPGGEEWLRDNERELRAAGVRRPETSALYSVFHALFFVSLMLLMLYFQRDNAFSNMLGGMAAAFILGWLLPKQVLYRMVKRYKERLQEALPDTVDMLGIVLGTGLALDQALLRVSEEMQHIYPELSGEFYTVVMQVKAGQERSKAFNQLVRRTGIEDVKSLSAMIVQSEKFGTSLSQALKVYAENLRTRRRLRAEAAISKAGIKMLFPIVLFILPALFVITLVPGMLSVMRDLKGGIGAGAR
ncbi:MAG: type II secretion system F family protein [Acidobacteria bacterium]|nr:type II secretion system F family protein [Acidobacteriota bacterium]